MAVSGERPGGAARGAIVLRVVGLGVVWTALVAALLLFGRAGRSFIYQGF